MGTKSEGICTKKLTGGSPDGKDGKDLSLFSVYPNCFFTIDNVPL